MTLPEHRAGDGDRDRVAAVLRDAHAEGRLDLDELTERLDATYRAKTFGELATLTDDLPTARPRSRPPGSEPAVRTSGSVPARRGDNDLRAVWTAWAVAVAVNVVIWALVSFSAGEAIYFWPMWVAGPWGAVLLVRTITRPR
ncbi:MAG: DUF1707 domain-containing protein [Jiangellales bacterium]